MIKMSLRFKPDRQLSNEKVRVGQSCKALTALASPRTCYKLATKNSELVSKCIIYNWIP